MLTPFLENDNKHNGKTAYHVSNLILNEMCYFSWQLVDNFLASWPPSDDSATLSGHMRVIGRRAGRIALSI